MRANLVRILAAAIIAWSVFSARAHASRRKISEAELCRSAEWVFVGTVTERDSIYDPRPDVYISSRVTMRVEAVAHGAPPPMVRFGVQGGVVDGERTVVSYSPTADVGSRYLIFGRLADARAGSGMRDRLQLDNQTASQPALTIIRHFLLKVGPLVPSSDELTAIWDEHCQTRAGSAGASRPTQRYLEFLPASVLEWCGHY